MKKKAFPLTLALLIAACGPGQGESGTADDSGMMADSAHMEGSAMMTDSTQMGGEMGERMEDSSSMGSGMMADSSSMSGTMDPDTSRMRD